MFWRANEKLDITPETRVILILGGSGLLGRSLLEKKPRNCLIVNVSKRNLLEGDGVMNFRFDLLQEPERAIHHVSTLVPFVDVFVYAAYSRNFASIERIERKQFLEEYELDVFTAVESTRLCATYFWSADDKAKNLNRARKAILISSAAAFGKTSRPELASYSAAKAALNALGPYIHDGLFDKYGVSVNILAPGSLRDPSTQRKTIDRFW